MRAAWCWTLACAVLAMGTAGAIPLAAGADRLVLAAIAVLATGFARGGMHEMGAATADAQAAEPEGARP